MVWVPGARRKPLERPCVRLSAPPSSPPLVLSPGGPSVVRLTNGASSSVSSSSSTEGTEESALETNDSTPLSPWPLGQPPLPTPDVSVSESPPLPQERPPGCCVSSRVLGLARTGTALTGKTRKRPGSAFNRTDSLKTSTSGHTSLVGTTSSSGRKHSSRFTLCGNTKPPPPPLRSLNSKAACSRAQLTTWPDCQADLPGLRSPIQGSPLAAGEAWDLGVLSTT